MIQKTIEAFNEYITYLDETDAGFLVKGEKKKDNSRADNISLFLKKIDGCKKCGLNKNRTNIVPGEGNPNARLMFIGEGPGADEDREGRPFVGKAGQLLTKIIEAMGLQRVDVYIGNIVKCRPENNRNPLPDEVFSCMPYIREQIEIISPQIICALGSVAANAILETSEGISKLRGRFHEYKNGIKVMPTFHPAYLLRNPSEKKTVWEDVQMIMKELDITR